MATTTLTVGDLVLRQVKGAPLTAAEHDGNIEALRDFCNTLSALLGGSFNTDGTLLDDSVETAHLQDRSVTKPKLSSTALPFYLDTGAVNALAITPTPALTGYEAGQVFYIQALNTVTGPATLEVNGLGVLPLQKLGGEELTDLDIEAGQVFCCSCTGTAFRIVSNVNRNFELPSGSLVQGVVTSTNHGAFSTVVATPALDATIPERSEGAEFTYLETVFTPQDAANILEIELQIPIALGAAGTGVAALFWDKDSPNSAIATGALTMSAGGQLGLLTVRHRMVVGYDTPITFTVNLGSNAAGGLVVNQVSGINPYGGTLHASLSIKEYVA